MHAPTVGAGPDGAGTVLHQQVDRSWREGVVACVVHGQVAEFSTLQFVYTQAMRMPDP